jgi:hypothetical protein
MIGRMPASVRVRRFAVAVVVFVAAVVLSPSSALAQDDERKSYDARLEGHADAVMLDGGSTALTWLALAGLGVLCIGVLFKNAKRTHLD